MKPQKQFEDIAILVRQAKQKIYYEANKTLIELYWEIGQSIYNQVKQAGWGRSVVKNLSDYLKLNFKDSNDFSPQNLWRMKQFYEAYHEKEKLSPLVREIS